MNTVRRILSESITHVEDLPIDKFVAVLRNMPNMSAQEKLDGANLWLGLDENGQFYTSREGKRKDADRRFKVEDWPLVSAFNQFRAAHSALEQKIEEIKTVLQPGDTVEAEVLFGRQPNSVTYGAGGKSFVAFLRGVNETPDEKAMQLGRTLANQEIEAKVTIVDTEDGEALNEVEQTFPFQFTTPQAVDSEHLKSAAHIDKMLSALESFLGKQSGFYGLSNMELLTKNLQQIDKDKRASVKQARADLLAKVATEYKLPIKQALLDKVVRKIRSGLADDDGDDIGIEGIVLRDPKTGDQIKIVDKDVFTTINKFNQSARQAVSSALNTVDPDASLESRGGLMGQLRIRIAELLGNRELAKAANVRKAMQPLKGATPEETIKNFAASMKGIDDYQAIKKKALAMMSETAQELKAKLEDFKANKDDYRLKLKNGKEMGLSEDTIKRTLLTFAEAKKNLSKWFDKVKLTQNLAQFLAVLYGAQAKSVHAASEDEPLEESLLMERAGNHEVDRHEFDGKDAFQILNTYLAIVFMSMVIYHEKDTPGIRNLRDKKNMALKEWHHTMSPLNHWGYAVWRCNKPDMKKQLPKKVQQELHQTVKHILAPSWKYLHMELSSGKDIKINWNDHHKTLTRLIELAGLRSVRLNSLLDWSVRWPMLTNDEKVKAMGKLYMFVMQFAPSSILFNRLRIIQQNSLLNATGTNTQMLEGKLLKSVIALAEEEGGEGGTDTYNQPVAATTTATQAAAVAARPTGVGNRVIVKRKRNPETVKRLTMKFPKPKENE